MRSILAILSVLAFACMASACPLTGAAVTYAPAAVVRQQVQYAPVQAQQAPVYAQQTTVAYAQAPLCAAGTCGGGATFAPQAGPLPAYGVGVQRSFGVGYGVGAAGFAPAPVFIPQRAFFPAPVQFQRTEIRRGLFGGTVTRQTTVIR